MFLALIFSHLWGVVELAALAQFTRTIRLRTILASLAAGFYGCSLLAIAFQFGWTRAAAGLTGATLNSIVALDSYTLGPLSEEDPEASAPHSDLGAFPWFATAVDAY